MAKQTLKIMRCSYCKIFKVCLAIFQHNAGKGQPFKRQPHKMVRHTQIISGNLPTNCLSVFDHFVGLALKRLKKIFKKYSFVSAYVEPNFFI